jgi:4'-phosphopantetheinyl transferase
MNVLESFRFPKRRNDWLLGRWTAKSALLRRSPGGQQRMTDWRIETDEAGAPGVFYRDDPVPVRLSLSHSQGQSLCALADQGVRIGCDLEKIELRSASFEETWFLDSEINLLDHHPGNDRASLVTLLWSAKESVLKALRKGLTVDTRRARITAFDAAHGEEWCRFSAQDDHAGDPFTGWWRSREGMIHTMVSDSSGERPAAL